MKVVETVKALRERRDLWGSKTVGFVPTMGSLHEGHLQLIKRAREECDIVVLSIFVNPIQFGENEDFDRYPRNWETDCSKAKIAGVDLLFHPSVDEMFPVPIQTEVEVKSLSMRLCGSSRPGHFTGVATIVSKLLNIVMPERAYFGLKDAQQVAVVQQLVQDLHFPVTIVPCPIVRESDGLAMSSRNQYLNPEERKQAAIIYQTLQKLKGLSWSTASEINQFVKERIASAPLARIDYVETVTFPTLEPIDQIQEQPIIVAVAVFFGATRLIDNILLNEQ